jgi:hypothetical protein
MCPGIDDTDTSDLADIWTGRSICLNQSPAAAARGLENRTGQNIRKSP